MGDLILHFWFELGNERAILLGFVDIMPSDYTILGTDWLTADAEGNLMTELKCTGRSAGPLYCETVITDGQWHRIGLVWDGSNRTLYIDGVAVADDIQPGLESSQMGLYIGTGKAMEPGTYFSGLIDDVRVYNQVVSP